MDCSVRCRHFFGHDDGKRIGSRFAGVETMTLSLLEIDCAPLKPGSGKIKFE
jgi:hypothetical protein